MDSWDHPQQTNGTLDSPANLFARPACTHIITMNNPNQNLHLERNRGGFRYTAGSHGDSTPHSQDYSSLEDFYQDRLSQFTNVRAAIWLDISDYPPFSYSVLYLPLSSPIEVRTLSDSEQVTPHGPYVVYGPVDVSATEPGLYSLQATAGWLVIQYPAITFRGGTPAILRPTRNIVDRVRLAMENRRLRHEGNTVTIVKPGGTVVYGWPPDDWQEHGQMLAPDAPAPAV